MKETQPASTSIWGMDRTETLNIGKTSPMAAAFVSTQEPRMPSHVFLGLMWGMSLREKMRPPSRNPLT